MTTVNLAFKTVWVPPDFLPDVVVGGSNVRGGLPDTSFSGLFRADAPVSSSPSQKKDVFAAFSIPCTVFEINSLQAYFFPLHDELHGFVGGWQSADGWWDRPRRRRIHRHHQQTQTEKKWDTQKICDRKFFDSSLESPRNFSYQWIFSTNARLHKKIDRKFSTVSGMISWIFPMVGFFLTISSTGIFWILPQ